jgi:hypothetical protein
MFGKKAPVWPFLTRFGGPADPLEPIANSRVFETYAVLAMIGLPSEDDNRHVTIQNFR